MSRIQRVDVGGEVDRIVKKYNIEQVLRSTGRPKKGGGLDFLKGRGLSNCKSVLLLGKKRSTNMDWRGWR